MEKKRILEEGLLEQYLTGELSMENQLMVEKALNEDKSLKEHFDQLEADFEKMAFEQAIEPPIGVKAALVHKLEKSPAKQVQWGPLWVAAGFALLFGVATFWMYGQWQNAERSLKSLQEQTVNLKERMDALESDYILTSSQLKDINGPHVIPLVLYGNQKSPGAKLVAYVDHNRKMVMVNSQGLPPLPASKTYQMWSDVEGEMINMGTLSPKEELIPLKYIEKAESLNITIEPAGGNDHPTVEELISNVII
ncbi:anti-sigma-K factor rskA [Flagellimonas meridianipacifica]|uniref:Anti-sigma-K factor rskA n=2 Tax=Flagellimonas meridianipacifica TaxID=1080225 RepID=A0A2T0M6S5_9FLAO|nr:anti-sigma-K factor rskA [Allomuricauda pacifica]